MNNSKLPLFLGFALLHRQCYNCVNKKWTRTVPQSPLVVQCVLLAAANRAVAWGAFIYLPFFLLRTTQATNWSKLRAGNATEEGGSLWPRAILQQQDTSFMTVKPQVLSGSIPVNRSISRCPLAFQQRHY
mmetsp:Transcript_89515/g.148794  ORF Transcript_89515/g.148794 Transcript_89515/m.148794 type:complete len:130 (+) Transcript_89515:209-598(+)